MKKVLVVEDNPLDMELILEILDAQGFVADGAGDGEDAIKRNKKDIYDLILMDIELPGLDGIEVTKIIKNNPACKDISVVALTACAMKGDKEKFLSKGFNEYIPKPIDVPGFIKILEKYRK